MKIAVNTRWLLPDKLEGFGWYTYHVLQELTRLFPEAEFHFFYDRKIASPLLESLEIHNHIVWPAARHPYLWHFWNQFSVPFMLKKIKADIYFSPDGFLPATLNIPALVTIHDLNFEAKDAFIKPQPKRYYQKHIRASAKMATHIFTISRFSTNDLITRYEVPPEKVSWAYNGPQKEFIDLHRFSQSTRQQFAGAHPYFLFVGAQNPRKNLHRIFQAFDAFCAKSNTRTALVLAGEKMLWDDEIEMAWQNLQHKDLVFFSGRVSSEDLNHLYSTAIALVFPSLFEGFGMPIVEAFYAGCPVITSLGSSTAEVAGDAALLIDPTRFEEIETAMEKIANDAALAEQLRQKGFARAPLFNWKSGAAQIAEKIRELTGA
jgi:glycosyltransferase involved in cell wall biosynthesis